MSASAFPGRWSRTKRFYAAEARAAFEDGDFEKALRTYGKVLEFNPRNAAAWTGQVRMLIELGEFDDAATWADKALELFPRDPELLAAKAVSLARNGDLQGAVAFSDTSIAEQAEVPYVWLARGDVLLSRRESRADYCFEKALLLAPRRLGDRLARRENSPLLPAVCARPANVPASPGIPRGAFSAVAGGRPLPAGAAPGQCRAPFAQPGPPVEPPMP